MCRVISLKQILLISSAWSRDLLLNEPAGARLLGQSDYTAVFSAGSASDGNPASDASADSVGLDRRQVALLTVAARVGHCAHSSFASDTAPSR
jgi:hypothetical protein